MKGSAAGIERDFCWQWDICWQVGSQLRSLLEMRNRANSQAQRELHESS